MEQAIKMGAVYFMFLSPGLTNRVLLRDGVSR